MTADISVQDNTYTAAL